MAAFSNDGRTLVSKSPAGLRLWDVATGKQLRELVRDSSSVNGSDLFTFHAAAFDNSCALSPDLRLRAQGSEVSWIGYHQPVSDNLLYIKDAATGRSVLVLQGHAEHLTCVVSSPDNRFFASGSCDGTVLLWEVPATLGSGRHPGSAHGEKSP